MTIENLTDRQIMEKVRLVYVRKKNQNRMYAMETMAAEIGLPRTTLYAAIMNKVASQVTVGLLKKYLADGQGDG